MVRPPPAAGVGSLGYCFSRDSLGELLGSAAVRNHVVLEDTDGLVARGITEIGRQCYGHLPSLCAHAGEGNSTVGHAANPECSAVRFDHEFRGYLDPGERRTTMSSPRCVGLGESLGPLPESVDECLPWDVRYGFCGGSSLPGRELHAAGCARAID